MSATATPSQRPRGDTEEVQVRLMTIPPRRIREGLAFLETRPGCLRPAEGSQPAPYGQGRRRTGRRCASRRSRDSVVAMPEVEIVLRVATDVLQFPLGHPPDGLGGHAHNEPARG